jgi:hypothetical protein
MSSYTEEEFRTQMLVLKAGLEQDALWEKITRLPRELKHIIGTYSYRVHTLKLWLRHQFFRRFTVENIDRILHMVSKWNKRQITWFMTNCNYFNYTCLPLKKDDLVQQLRKRMDTGCEKHSHGQWLYCIFHARKVWQRLRIIEHIDNTFKSRKNLDNKRRKAEKRAREINIE